MHYHRTGLWSTFHCSRLLEQRERGLYYSAESAINTWWYRDPQTTMGRTKLTLQKGWSGCQITENQCINLSYIPSNWLTSIFFYKNTTDTLLIRPGASKHALARSELNRITAVIRSVRISKYFINWWLWRGDEGTFTRSGAKSEHFTKTFKQGCAIRTGDRSLLEGFTEWKEAELTLLPGGPGPVLAECLAHSRSLAVYNTLPRLHYNQVENSAGRQDPRPDLKTWNKNKLEQIYPEER